MEPRAGLLVVTEGQSLVMDHRRTRLVEHLVAPTSQVEAEVDLLVVAWREDPVESAPFGEQVLFHHQRRAAAVVDLPGEVVTQVVLAAAPPEIPPRPVGEDDPARLLQAPVGIDELGPDRSHARLLDPLEKGFEPPRGHRGVIVQEEEVSPACNRGAVIGGVKKARVAMVSDDTDSRAADELRQGLFGRGVIDEDDLGQQVGVGVAPYAFEAGHRLLVAVVRTDDDRDGRPRVLAASHDITFS